MKPRPEPLSERLRALVPTHRELIQEIEGLERITSAGVAHVVSNNKNPKDWPLERWLAVLTFSMGLTGAIVGGIWFAGGEWTQVKTAVALVPMLVAGQASTQAEVQAVGIRVTEIQAEQRRVMQELSAPRVRPAAPARMAFPRTEQLETTVPR